MARDDETFEVDSHDVRDTQRRVALLIYHRDGSDLVTLEPGMPIVVGRSSPADVPVKDSSLSRTHAQFELRDQRVTVTDLGSTNGTFVNDVRVESQPVAPRDQIRLGLVTVALHVTSPSDGDVEGLLGYDELFRQLEVDVARAKTLGRTGALLMVRGEERIGRWHEQVRAALRSIDRIAAYGPSEGLVWLEDVTREVAAGIADRIASLGLTVGGALAPDVGVTADELVDVTRAACHDASPGRAHLVAGRATTDEPALPQVVESPSMQRLYHTAQKVARSPIPVLIYGETGSGKEVLARAIHRASPRRDGPLRSINCGAIPSQLIESALFGHVRGAFTGAESSKLGLFEEADGGTLFLDEIGELSAPAQVALLRVLEERRVRRVGATEETEVDVRIVAATHRDLEQMVEKGDFREDLLYRLNVMTLEIPPLRDRPEEILPFADLFRRVANDAYGCDIRSISRDAAAQLTAHRWPGNVRELRNAIDRAVVIAEGHELTVDDLPKRVRGTAAAPPAPAAAQDQSGGDLRSRVKAYEKNLLLETLERCDWNLTKAAEALNLPYRTLTAKMKTFEIKRPK